MLWVSQPWDDSRHEEDGSGQAEALSKAGWERGRRLHELFLPIQLLCLLHGHMLALLLGPRTLGRYVGTNGSQKTLHATPRERLMEGGRHCSRDRTSGAAYSRL